MEKEPIIFSWSGGKDSSMALHKILSENTFEVKYLLTTIYKPLKRVSMHGVPESLMISQAKSIGIPLKIIYIEEKTHSEYEDKMRAFLLEMKKEGINKVAFGDIFLEDLKKYREDKLAEVDMTGIFPLWRKSTNDLAQHFIKQGFKTHICSVNNSKIDPKLAGTDYSLEFLCSLKEDVDPCGENGEFHSFCYDGPIFNHPVAFKQNGTTLKTYSHDGKNYEFTFSDIEPITS